MENISSKSAARRRAAIGASVGTLIEYYDYYLYGLAAATVFPKIFFPNDSATVALLSSFASFAIGFLLRPIGGIVFGHVGDRAGRKAALMITVIGMGLATTAIGLIPSAERIGLMAPILLIVCRSLQGLFVGGEMGGAATLIVEHAPPGRRSISWLRPRSCRPRRSRRVSTSRSRMRRRCSTASAGKASRSR